MQSEIDHGGLTADYRFRRTPTVTKKKKGQRNAGPVHMVEFKVIDVAVERWQQFTGETAVLEISGEAFEEMRAER